MIFTHHYNLPTEITIVQKQHFWKLLTTFWWKWILSMLFYLCYLTWALPLTLLIIVFCCIDWLGLSRSCQQEVNVFPFPAPSLTVFLLTEVFHKGPVLGHCCVSSTLQSYLTSLNVTLQILTVMQMIHQYICPSSPLTCQFNKMLLTALQNCIDDIRSWMDMTNSSVMKRWNFLSLAPSNSYLKLIFLRSLWETVIMKSSVVRNLGSYIDDKLSMNSHINKVCNASFYYLHNIRRIRKHLSRDPSKTAD